MDWSFLRSITATRVPALTERRWDALIDTDTKVLLIASTYLETLVFLNEHMPNVLHVKSISSPNYLQGLPIKSVSPEHYTEWRWDKGTRMLKRTPVSLRSLDFNERSALAIAKYRLHRHVVEHLDRARDKMRTGILLQEYVYLDKKLQAQRFKASGYDETNAAAEYPLVLQYADFAGISLQDAADEILFKAKLDDAHLASTELLRLKYMAKIRDMTSPSEYPAIREEFFHDCYR